MEIRTITIPIKGQKATIIWDRENQSELIVPPQLRTIQYVYDKVQDLGLFPLYSDCGHIGWMFKVTGEALRLIRSINPIVNQVEKQQEHFQESPRGKQCSFCRRMVKASSERTIAYIKERAGPRPLTSMEQLLIDGLIEDAREAMFPHEIERP